MVNITIFGKGNMGQAIGGNFAETGNVVNYITTKTTKQDLGEIIIFAVPYSAVSSIVELYKDELRGKTIIDITNPVNFETFDDLVVPSDSSAAGIISTLLPESFVIKGFNTNFANTLSTKNVGGEHPTTVLLAGDNEEAKEKVIKTLDGSNLNLLDVGSLKRARELESLGFLQISLAGSDKISWQNGFSLFE